jgi:hypothetical protein
LPYRHAHWVLLFLLAPVVLLAFWPSYFGAMRGATFAFHAHGLSASAWLLLVALQSWSVHSRRFALHRASGRAVMVVVPLFAGGAALVVHSMSLKYAAGHPFYGIFGPRLGLHDLISTVALVAMVRAALVRRRVAALHGGFMLGTVLLVLPPVLARLPLPIPPWLHAGELLGGLIALALYLRAPRTGLPFLVVIGVMLLDVLEFETVGASALWARGFGAIGTLPAAPLALAAAAGAAAALFSAWPGIFARGRKVRRGAPVTAPPQPLP